MKTLKILLLLSLVSALPLFAWGEKGHSIVNEAATYGVPAQMPTFFHQAYPRLVYLGYDPDRWRGAGPSLDAVNPPNHFLDYEYVADLDLPNDRYEFIELMTRQRVPERFSVDIADPGFLPWRIAEVADQLTGQWRLWNGTKDPADREQIEQNIVYLAGVLGHYAGDSANPHHTTINYNGWVMPNPNGYPTDCETHFRFESDFVNHAISARDVFPKVAAPQLRTDYFATALAAVREANSLTGQLYQIDRDGGFKPHEGTAAAREFATARLAAGASLLRDLWWSAYKNGLAPKPARR